MCRCTGGLAAYACHFARSRDCVCACRGNCHGSRVVPMRIGINRFPHHLPGSGDEHNPGDRVYRGSRGASRAEGNGTRTAKAFRALAKILGVLQREGIFFPSNTHPAIQARHRRIRLGGRKGLRWAFAALGLSRTPEGGWAVQLPLDPREDGILWEVAALLTWLEAENPGVPVRDIGGEAARHILEVLEAAGWGDGP